MLLPTSLTLRRGGARRGKRQRTRSGRSQTKAYNSDSTPIPFEGLSVNDEPITDENGEERSTMFQYNSWSLRNESIIRRRGFLARRKTKQSTTGRSTTGKSRHSSKRVSEASHGNERNADDSVDLGPSALRNKDVVDRSIMSGGASTSDNSGSRKVLVIENEGKGQTRFVRVSCFIPFLWNVGID